jgi:hypothetical protein
MFNAITLNMGLDIEKLNVCVEHWGVEFYKEECEAPFEFGGWYSVYDKGYNMANILYQYDYNWYWAYKAIHQSINHKGRLEKFPTSPLGRKINARWDEPKDIDINITTKLEDLFGDKKSVSFYRNQTEKGYDNTGFCVYLEQAKASQYFKKNHHKIPWDSLEDELVARGYIPKYDKNKLYQPFHTVEVEVSDVKASDYNNSRLALELAKLGVWYNHPLLNKELMEANYDVIAYTYKPNLGLPMSGLKSVAITESNISLMDYCLENHGLYPKLDVDSWDALWLTLGFKGDPHVLEQLINLYGVVTYQQFVDASNEIFEMCQSKIREEARAEEQALTALKIKNDVPKVKETHYLCYYPEGSLGATYDDEGNFVREERFVSFLNDVDPITAYGAIRNMGLSCQELDDLMDIQEVDMEGNCLFGDDQGDY